jgi:hypothetical protein
VTHNRSAVDRLAQTVVYLDRTVVATGRPDEVFGRLEERAVNGGHDHPARGDGWEEE